MARAKVSKLVATGMSVSATFAGVGLIAHADDTSDGDDAVQAPVAVPVAVAVTAPTTAVVTGDEQADDGLSSTEVVVTATTVLDVPGAPALPTKSTSPALALPVPTFVDNVPLPMAATPDPAAPVTSSAGPVSRPAATTVTAAPARAPVAPPPTAPPTATTAPPPPVTAAPVTTAPPPPPPTLPALTAPPDDTSRGTQ